MIDVKTALMGGTEEQVCFILDRACKMAELRHRSGRELGQGDIKRSEFYENESKNVKTEMLLVVDKMIGLLD